MSAGQPARTGPPVAVRLMFAVIGTIIVAVVLAGIVVFGLPVVGQLMGVVTISGPYSSGGSTLKGLFSTFAIFMGIMVLAPVAGIGLLLFYGGGSSGGRLR